MSRIAFIASFLAAFITMDAEFFDGEHTRATWMAANGAAKATQAQLYRWLHPIGGRT